MAIAGLARDGEATVDTVVTIHAIEVSRILFVKSPKTIGGIGTDQPILRVVQVKTRSRTVDEKKSPE